MSTSKLKVLLIGVGLFFIAYCANNLHCSNFISIVVDIKKSDTQLYWKNDKGVVLQSIKNLKNYVESKNHQLLFAMNGGMYLANHAPLGLFIQHGKTLSKLNVRKGKGNFYLEPNGVFCISKNKLAIICSTRKFANNGNIEFATQSGPLLVMDGAINHCFAEKSKNVNIRNGVGLMPDNKVVFAMSKKAVNFYDFAKFFKELGCKNALFLDGCISQTYFPAKNWKQLGGDFGVMIGVTEKKK